jgi:hypothetical protein
MPYEIDTDKINDPSLQILDIGKPPLRQMAIQHYPKMVYLHPRDKAKSHMTQIVQNEAQLDAATKQGWKLKPHVPIEATVDLSQHFEAEAPDPLDRMSKEELLDEAKRRGISIDGRSSNASILAAVKAQPVAA